MIDAYTADEQARLLTVARQTLEAVTNGLTRPSLDLGALPATLKEQRACFVTFQLHHDLRGCTGTLMARRPLAEEVSYMTVQTAFNDPRFPPVVSSEVPDIEIEISILTPPTPLKFSSPDELITLIRPLTDGVTLKLGPYRSTFLPQVWERIPEPREFLTLLSQKMGLPGNAWRHPELEVEVYQTVIVAEMPHNLAKA